MLNNRHFVVFYRRAYFLSPSNFNNNNDNAFNVNNNGNVNNGNNVNNDNGSLRPAISVKYNTGYPITQKCYSRETPT